MLPTGGPRAWQGIAAVDSSGESTLSWCFAYQTLVIIVAQQTGSDPPSKQGILRRCGESANQPMNMFGLKSASGVGDDAIFLFRLGSNTLIQERTYRIASSGGISFRGANFFHP